MHQMPPVPSFGPAAPGSVQHPRRLQYAPPSLEHQQQQHPPPPPPPPPAVYSAAVPVYSTQSQYSNVAAYAPPSARPERRPASPTRVHRVVPSQPTYVAPAASGPLVPSSSPSSPRPSSAAAATAGSQQQQQQQQPKPLPPTVVEKGPAELGFLGKMSVVVHTTMHGTFGSLAETVTSFPRATIALTLLLTVALALGVLRFEEELDGSKLFAPRDSRAVEEDEWVQATFGYAPLRSKFFFVSEDGNMLTARNMMLVHDVLRHVTTQLSASADDGTVSFATICATKQPRHPLGYCMMQRPTERLCRAPESPLALWDHDGTVIARLTDADVLAAVNNETQWRVHVPTGPGVRHYLSTVGLETSNGKITKAKAVTATVLLKNERGDQHGGRAEDPDSKALELAMVDYLHDGVAAQLKRSHNVRVDVQTTAEEDEAGESAMNDDFGVLAAGYIVMIGFACFVLGRSRLKYSHAALGLASVFSVGMATISAYGLCWYIGLKFNTVTQVLILVLLGIGIDDTFVIMDSWWDTCAETDMKQRMVKALAHAGPAITITSLTDLVAFLAGSSTAIPALQVFCYYACLGIFFVFTYQITFFVAVAYLDSNRQAAARRDCCCCFHAAEDALWCGCTASAGSTHHEGDRGLLHRILGTYLPRLLLGNAVGRIIALLAAATLVGLGAYGLTQVKMNYNGEWFVPDGHRFRDVMALRDEFFDGRTLATGVYTKELNYADPLVQFQLEDQLRVLDSSRWVVTGSTSSWLRAFTAFVAETAPEALVPLRGQRVVAAGSFYPLLKRFISAEGPPEASEQVGRLVWDGCPTEPGSRVTAAVMNFVVVPEPLENGEDAVSCMDDLRAILDQYPTSFPFAFPFIFWESYKVFLPEVVQNVAVAAACVLVLVTVLAANIYIGLFVIVALGCVDVCLLGFMPFVGVELNGVSVICIVLAIGLAVDYSVHIAEAFLTRTAEDMPEHSARAQRAAYALWKMGPAVVNGGLSTFLAVAPLLFAVSYVFKVFFRMFFLIIFFGLFFGVLVLPVILSLCGPAANPLAEPLCPEENPLHPDFGTAKPAKSDPSLDMPLPPPPAQQQQPQHHPLRPAPQHPQFEQPQPAPYSPMRNFGVLQTI